ncbi:unnamed protein product [Cochlearia groenlandica]
MVEKACIKHLQKEYRSLCKAASVKVDVGSYVWVEDTYEAWLDGEVVEVNDEEVKVNCETKMSNPVLEAFGNAKLSETIIQENQSNCYALSSFDDSKEYLATRKVMDVVGLVLKNMYFAVSHLLPCDEKIVEDSRVMVTRGESITKSLDPGSATLSRDALAKIVYFETV